MLLKYIFCFEYTVFYKTKHLRSPIQNLLRGFEWLEEGMENFSGKWILVDTFFQNEEILVDIFHD